jgi:phosphoenolpyruvate synthase/pyruvate phosphate dikinase
MGNIAWFSEISKKDINEVGSKAVKISEMYRASLSIPPGFVVTANAFKHFIEENNIDIDDITAAKDRHGADLITDELQGRILSGTLSNALADEIRDAYNNLNISKDIFLSASKQALDIIKAGREPPSVAIRCSISNISNRAVYINIKGIRNIITSIQKCWAYLFNPENIENIIPVNGGIAAGIIVQKMVNADKSGIVYITNDNLSIHAIFGLCGPLIHKSILPDIYTVEKASNATLSRQINSQEWKLAVDTSTGQIVKKRIYNDDISRPKLEDYEIKRLSDLAKNAERHYNMPMAIEFGIEGNQAYVIGCEEYSPEKEQASHENEQSAVNETKPDEGLDKGMDTITAVNAIISSAELAEKAAAAGAEYAIIAGDGIIIGQNEDPATLITNGKKDGLVGSIVNELNGIMHFFNGQLWYKLIKCQDAIILNRRRTDYGHHPEINDTTQMELLKAELEAVEQVYNNHHNIGLLIPMVTDTEQIRYVKNLLHDAGFNGIKIGAVIETPAAVQTIKEICEEGISFVMIGAANLTMLSMAAADEKTAQNTMHKSIMRQIQHVINICNEHSIKTCADYTSENDEFLGCLINLGVNSIATNPATVKKAKDFIAKFERKLLLDAARKNFKI